MLTQLVYVSSRKGSGSQEEIDDILEACMKNNPDLGITGALLYSDSKFLQLVEGENKVVMGLYDKIKEDKRHSNCVLLSYMPIKEKSFPSWHMGSKEISTGEVEYNTSISAQDQAIFSKLLNGNEADGHRTKEIVSKFFN